MKNKQRVILDWVRNNNEITKSKAIELIGGSYYCNSTKHVGDILSRMVKSGLLHRVKNGLFVIGTRVNSDPVTENQLRLFA
ncbi:hypothetical protein [uncultured Chryseobacterium sp.]|uniref:hypothetical protein n=1 Tax=uncultured Chryseobacterium sp. TaxID=259322 RepID=UPI0025902CB4|nr:hypothetical protein [uncultured Chryseobacterium sp.]